MTDPFLAKLRELTQGDVDDHTLITPGHWDSIDVLDLIAAIDATYDVTIPIKDLAACTSVGQLRAAIRHAQSA